MYPVCCAGSPGGSLGIKNPPATWETQVRSLGREDPLGKRNDNSLQRPCLGNLTDRGARRGHSPRRSQRLGHDWATNAFTFWVICVRLFYFRLKQPGVAVWHSSHPAGTRAQRHTHTLSLLWACVHVALSSAAHGDPVHASAPRSCLRPPPLPLTHQSPSFPPYQPCLSLPASCRLPDPTASNLGTRWRLPWPLGFRSWALPFCSKSVLGRQQVRTAEDGLLTRMEMKRNASLLPVPVRCGTRGATPGEPVPPPWAANPSLEDAVRNVESHRFHGCLETATR